MRAVAAQLLHRNRRRSGVVRRLLAAPLAAATAVLWLSACGSGSGSSAGPTPSAPSATQPSGVPLSRVLYLDFEDAPPVLDNGTPIADAAPGGPDGTVTLGGPRHEPLRLVAGRGDSGHGVAFPVPCPYSPQPSCPKSIIEMAPDPVLDPRAGDLAWGASILLRPDQTSKGSNVLQKGFSRGGASQWKLQVDGVDGFPSCVVVGQEGDEIHEVKAAVTVADSRWHDVSCRRAGDDLVIRVDEQGPWSVTLPSGLTVAPPGPVRIGGKSLKPNNDQFFGTLDDVFVATPSS